MEKIWYTGIDNGDGSLDVGFYNSQECIELLEKTFPESFRGEGGNYFFVGDYHNLVIASIEDVRNYIKDMTGED